MSRTTIHQHGETHPPHDEIHPPDREIKDYASGVLQCNPEMWQLVSRHIYECDACELKVLILGIERLFSEPEAAFTFK